MPQWFFCILYIIVYPLLLATVLTIFLIVGIIWLFQGLAGRRPKAFLKSELEKKNCEEAWVIWVDSCGVVFLRKYMGEIRFGPAYFSVKSESAIPGLENKLFGDWCFKCDCGVFFQQWNSTAVPDADLVYFDPDRGSVRAIEKSIPSVLWSVVERGNGLLVLNCDTGRKIIKYEIEMESVAKVNRREKET